MKNKIIAMLAALSVMASGVFMTVNAVNHSADSSSAASNPDGTAVNQGPDIEFVDVPANHQQKADIEWMAARGISTGWTIGQGGRAEFRPSAPVERAAFAAFLYRMAGMPAYTAPKTSAFKDVPTSHPFYKEISWLASTGITTGWPDGTFRPAEPITRDAIAAFLYRYVCATSNNTRIQFKDVTASNFLKEINWMKDNGLSTGWADGTYRPQSYTERGAIAAFLHRMDSKGFKFKAQCTVAPRGQAKPTTTPKPTVTPKPTPKPTATTAAPKTATLSTVPTAKDESGTASDTLTLPNVAGVVWTVDGKAKNPGTYKATDLKGAYTASATATVKAALAPGYTWKTTPAKTSWAFTWKAETVRKKVTLKAVTWNDANGMSNDSFTIPKVEGVDWTIFVGGSYATDSGTPGTHKVSEYKRGDYSGGYMNVSISAHLKEGYEWADTSVAPGYLGGDRQASDPQRWPNWTIRFSGYDSTKTVTAPSVQLEGSGAVQGAEGVLEWKVPYINGSPAEIDNYYTVSESWNAGTQTVKLTPKAGVKAAAGQQTVFTATYSPANVYRNTVNGSTSGLVQVGVRGIQIADYNRGLRASQHLNRARKAAGVGEIKTSNDLDAWAELRAADYAVHGNLNDTPASRYLTGGAPLYELAYIDEGSENSVDWAAYALEEAIKHWSANPNSAEYKALTDPNATRVGISMLRIPDFDTKPQIALSEGNSRGGTTVVILELASKNRPFDLKLSKTDKDAHNVQYVWVDPAKAGLKDATLLGHPAYSTKTGIKVFKAQGPIWNKAVLDEY